MFGYTVNNYVGSVAISFVYAWCVISSFKSITYLPRERNTQHGNPGFGCALVFREAV